MKEALMSDIKTEAENYSELNDYAEKKFKLLGFYNYTVILTYVGMLTAFVGITAAFSGNFFKSAICLMVAGLCDMFDGAIASTKKRSSREKLYGIQIDSLSDLISFGVLPAIFIYSAGSSGGRMKLFASGFYVLCALIRLAYFNVTEEERQNITEKTRNAYLGLPVTASALILPFIYIINGTRIMPRDILLYTSVIIMGVAFLLPVNIKKPRTVGKIVMFIIGCTELFLLITRTM